jgi:acetate kinase
MNVLVANTGSSSLKLRLIDDAGAVRIAADLPAPGDPLDEAPIHGFLQSANDVQAVGHRIVHGGPNFRDATIVDEHSIEQLEALADLAPLHNGPALEVLAALRRLLPNVPHVACFDTAFHATLPDAAALYALPWHWIERHGLRRYGFHGISHAWAARRAAALLNLPIEQLRLVTCHLGAGASLAAVKGGRSVDTTMGFTPNDGLVMATRSGSVDPGLLLWLERDAGISPDELDHALEHDSGLRGLSGRSGDMRELLEGAASDEQAATALDVYVHRLRAGIASMAAAMDGIDAVVFTGGVGEHAPVIRARACDGLGFLGLALDSARNEPIGDDDTVLSADDATAKVLLIHSREDLEMARLVHSALVA